jgi:hypothetical protein
LAAPRRVELAREPSKTDPTRTVPARVTFQVTEAQRRGLGRILDAAKREHVQLSEGDVMRVALDELLAAVDRFQSEPPAAPAAEAPAGAQESSDARP